jgi:polyisoprenoid-binding protein YceI
MKKIITSIALLFLVLGQSKAQNLYSTNGGETSFFSSTPVEDISAVNKTVQSILNTTTGEIVVQMAMKQFTFPNKLMQEHFNENYMESEKYPKAIFKGKINEMIDYSKSGTYDISATGDFTIHGIARPRTLKGKLTVAQGSISIMSEFDVSLTDHKIDVPKIVFVKIAQTIKVKNSLVLLPYKKN